MLIVDLDSDTLGDPESDGVLALCTEDSLRELSGFGLVKGRSLWPSAEGVRRFVELYRKLASLAHLPHSRSSPYMAADEGFPDPTGLPLRSGPASPQAIPVSGAADTRLEALEAQVRALVTSQTALLSAQRDTGQSNAGAGRAGTSAPPVFEAEAGRAGLSLEQLTALLGAAGRPPERLHDGRPAALPGARTARATCRCRTSPQHRLQQASPATSLERRPRPPRSRPGSPPLWRANSTPRAS